jgi:hypothetical protein
MRRHDAALNMLAFIAILVVFVVIDRRRERRRRAELASILRGVVWLIQRSPDAWRIVLQLCADADSLRAGCSNGALSRRYKRRSSRDCKRWQDYRSGEFGNVIKRFAG